MPAYDEARPGSVRTTGLCYPRRMGKAEIIDALSRLSLAERSEILARLVQLEAAEDQGPMATEQELLDAEIEDYRADPTAGAPWNAVEARLRRRQ